MSGPQPPRAAPQYWCFPGGHTGTCAHTPTPARPGAHSRLWAGAPLRLPLPFLLLCLPPPDPPGLPSAPWLSPCPVGEDEAPSFCHAAWEALPGPGAHATPPRAGLTSAWLPSRALGLQVRLGVLRAAGAPAFIPATPGPVYGLGCTCPPSLPLPGTPAWRWPPRGARWHLARPHWAGQTVSSAWSPQGRGGGGESRQQTETLLCEVPPTLPAGLVGLRGEGRPRRWLAGPARVTQGVQAGQHV